MKRLYFSLFFFLATLLSCHSVAEKQKKEDSLNALAKLKTPIFWVEGHPGNLNKEHYTIEIKGLCKKPQTISYNTLLNMQKAVVDARLTSVTKWSVRGLWGGVRIKDILDSVGVLPNAKFVRFWSFGLKYDTSIPIDIALKEKTLLAYEFNNEPLTEDYGGPVRVFCPYLWGYKSAKTVVCIEIMDHYVPGFWEKRGYTDSGEIQSGFMRDMNDQQRIKKIPDGEVIHFIED